MKLIRSFISTCLASYWLVTKRLLKGLFIKPEGWPKGASIVKGSLQSYKMLRLSPKFWNDDFFKKLDTLSQNKSLHVIETVAELNGFTDAWASSDRVE